MYPDIIMGTRYVSPGDTIVITGSDWSLEFYGFVLFPSKERDLFMKMSVIVDYRHGTTIPVYTVCRQALDTIREKQDAKSFDGHHDHADLIHRLQGIESKLNVSYVPMTSP